MEERNDDDIFQKQFKVQTLYKEPPPKKKQKQKNDLSEHSCSKFTRNFLLNFHHIFEIPCLATVEVKLDEQTVKVL